MQRGSKKKRWRRKASFYFPFLSAKKEKENRAKEMDTVVKDNLLAFSSFSVQKIAQKVESYWREYFGFLFMLLLQRP